MPRRRMKATHPLKFQDLNEDSTYRIKYDTLEFTSKLTKTQTGYRCADVKLGISLQFTREHLENNVITICEVI